MRNFAVKMIAAVGVVLATARGGAWQNSSSIQNSQAPPQSSRQSSHPTALDDSGASDSFKDKMQEQASRNRNSERHKRIVADTEKLLQLSTELKAEVDKTTKDELSVQVIQKAAEIEKLAHDVKERMKG